MEKIYCIHRWIQKQKYSFLCVICGEPWNKKHLKCPPEVVIGYLKRPILIVRTHTPEIA